MTLALVPALRRARVRLRFRPDWRHPAVRKVLRLSAWTIGYVVANQIALLVIYNLTEPGGGDLSAYQLAFVFFQLPHGLLAVSITTTFTPDLARAWHRGDLTDFKDRMSLGLRVLGLLIIPASVGYLVLAKPLVVAALQRGSFTAADADLTANALAAFSLGLFGFSAYLFVLRGFYAQQDTKTPFWINVGENAVNIVLAVALVGAFGVTGLSAAFSVAYAVAAVLAFVVLHRRVGGLDVAGIGASLVRITVAAGGDGGGGVARRRPRRRHGHGEPSRRAHRRRRRGRRARLPGRPRAGPGPRAGIGPGRARPAARRRAVAVGGAPA